MISTTDIIRHRYQSPKGHGRRVLTVARTVIRELTHPGTHSTWEVRNYSNRIIRLKCTSDALRREIKSKEATIVAIINQELGYSALDGIAF